MDAPRPDGDGFSTRAFASSVVPDDAEAYPVLVGRLPETGIAWVRTHGGAWTALRAWGTSVLQTRKTLLGDQLRHSAPRSVDRGTPYFLATAATGTSSARS